MRLHGSVVLICNNFTLEARICDPRVMDAVLHRCKPLLLPTKKPKNRSGISWKDRTDFGYCHRRAARGVHGQGQRTATADMIEGGKGIASAEFCGQIFDQRVEWKRYQ